jgi:LmbE family N-acetylglucosaminyl deacetylase
MNELAIEERRVASGFVDLATLRRPTRHVFLSPHYDDIALSSGGTAALAANGPGAADVALIFGDHPDPDQPLTAFAQSLHQQWGMDAGSVIAGRRAEEAKASEILGTRDLFLPFRDAIYRGERYTSDPVLFSQPAEDEADLPRQIAEAAGLSGPADASVRVYAPLAIGFHVDHQHAFIAGMRLAREGWEVWFYEDLPYALRDGAKDRRLAAIGTMVKSGPLIDVEPVWTEKIDAIMAYPSQLSTIFGDYVGVGSTRDAIDGAMSRYARELGGGQRAEHFWIAA